MRRLFANSGVAQSKGEMDFAAVSVSVPSHGGVHPLSTPQHRSPARDPVLAC